DHHIRPRRGLRDGEKIGKLPLAHPMADFDRLPVDFRDDGIRAAEREQRHDRELHRERDENIVISHRRTHHASAIETGTSTIITEGKGSRRTPTDTAIATNMNGAGPILWNKGIAMRATVEIITPAAAAAIPPSTRRSAAASPYCA